ncbi:lysis system i-spanin subunit Rz [Vogesella oryzae]|uniref:lysis system i-spanin subunit Rz n=1 Tax=Vogesella oryzae TaxID=1735285 RepID=UPI001582179A|nr:lysis system i-spanin subunit Rz [Vogesella oryzae]
MWRKAIPWLVLLAALAGSHWWAYSHGKQVVTLARDLADATRERDNNATINDLQQQRRRDDAVAATKLLAAEESYRKGLLDVQAEKNRILADAAAGRLRLSIPVKPASCPAAGTAANVAEGGADPAPRAELSDAATEFLVGLASEADAVAVELNRCADRVDVLETHLRGLFAGTGG